MSSHTPFALASDETICLECSVDTDVRWHDAHATDSGVCA